VLSLYSDLAAITSPLSEATDVTAVTIANPDRVTVTLQEYGNAAIVTRFLEATALSDVDPAIANIIAYNCANSIDGLAQTALATIGTTNVLGTSSTGSTTITANPTKTNLLGTNLISSAAVRYAVAKLRANNVVPTRGNLYTCYIHPEVSHDLRAETGAGGWRESHITGAPDVIWPGEIGQYEGAAFVENSRCLSDTGGNSSARIFNTYFLGQQALAEASAQEPHIVIGPVVDRLARFRPIGWHAILGWSLYRTAASYKLWTSSSIHAA
jgi:N4-gp56 family major capsid protein